MLPSQVMTKRPLWLTIPLLLTAAAVVLWTHCNAAEKAPKQPKPEPGATITVHISLADLVIAKPALDKLFAFELPVKTAWDLRKNVSAVEAETKRFEEQRNALIKKHGKPSGRGFMVPPENFAAFNEDAKQLSEITVDLQITPISLALFGESAKLSAADMAHLERFLIP